MRALARLFVAVALLALPIAAQEQQQPPRQQQPAAGPEAHLEVTAARYGAEKWPAPGPRQAGLAVGQLEVEGWERRTLEVDPERAEAVLTFAASKQDRAGALLRLRLAPGAKAARRALLEQLGAVQRKLDPEPGPWDAAFAARVEGKLQLLLAVRGEVTLALQRINQGGELEPIARAAEQLVLSAPKLVREQVRPAPRLLRAELGPPADEFGAPLRGDETGARTLRLEWDRAGPAGRHLRFEAPEGVGLLQAEDGTWRVQGAAPGLLRLVAWAASDELQSARLELQLDAR